MKNVLMTVVLLLIAGCTPDKVYEGKCYIKVGESVTLKVTYCTEYICELEWLPPWSGKSAASRDQIEMTTKEVECPKCDIY